MHVPLFIDLLHPSMAMICIVDARQGINPGREGQVHLTFLAFNSNVFLINFNLLLEAPRDFLNPTHSVFLCPPTIPAIHPRLLMDI